MGEPLPLATIHQAIFEFLRGRDDVVVFGASAVNAYVGEARMTEDIDLISPRAPELAEELRQYLGKRFHIAIRVRVIGAGKGYRLFQIRKSGNRHLIDLRRTASIPDARRIGEILVMSPHELIARKVISYHSRRGQPKSGTDWRDLAMLLLTFPDLKTDTGIVADSLHSLEAHEDVMNTWRELVELEITQPTEEDEFT